MGSLSFHGECRQHTLFPKIPPMKGPAKRSAQDAGRVAAVPASRCLFPFRVLSFPRWEWMTPPELERLVQIGTLNSTLSDLASSVRWPSSPQPSSPILPPDLTGEEGEIRSKTGSGALSLPSGREGGWEREGWESEGLPKGQHSPAGNLTK